MRLLLLLTLLLTWSAAFAQTPPIVVHGTPNWKNGLDFKENMSFYIDTARSPLSFEEVKTKPFRPIAEEPDYHNTDVAVMHDWHRFQVTNTHPTDTAQLFFLHGAHYRAFLYQDSTLVARTGSDFSTNASPFITLVVPPASTHTYWLQTVDYVTRITGVWPALYTHQNMNGLWESMLEATKPLFLILSSFVGALLFMTLYSLYHFYLTRERIFGYYTLYVAAACVGAMLSVEQRFQLYFLTKLFSFSPPGETRIDVMSFNFIIPIFYILFVAQLLDLKTTRPRIWLLLKIIMGILAVQQVLGLYQTNTRDYFYSITYYQHRNEPFLVASLILFYAIVRSRSALKPFLLTGTLAFIVLVFFPLTFRFQFPGVSQWPAVGEVLSGWMFWIQLGMTIEALCFAMALAYRSRLIELERDRIQQNYAHDLEAKLAERTQEIDVQNRLLEAQHIRQLEAEFEQKLADTEMTALRAQMNPHFIFNCLNSIKLYTLQNDADKASDHLTKFARLIRLVLENSRSELVPLQNELEALQLYIELEAMRFKHKVQFAINVAPEIDQRFLCIPPLLVQPYVENAIWHGLMHKPEGGMVSLDVTQPQDNLLHIEITDDGVGRERAAELKSKSAGKHKSFGMQVTADRIRMINQLYNMQTQTQIVDLIDSFGEPCGTRVILEIPV